ncbi:hypothetical protein DRQ18_01885 [bacterium]|nr:MAG: hypothetical protein DRQ18_01885 [bacterium]
MSSDEKRITDKYGITFNEIRRLSLNGRSEEEMLESVLVKETWFIRGRRQFEFLKERFGKKELIAWSCGCATGEEAYSIAMALEGATVWGTDVSKSAIEFARRGVYKKRALRELRKDEVLRFFVKEGAFYRVKNEIKERVYFMVSNLLSPPPFNFSFDLIMLRNVLMYFSGNARKKAVENVVSVLKTGGILLLGDTEFLLNLPGDLKPVKEGDVYYYIRVAHR